jgi:hypothetical protein
MARTSLAIARRHRIMVEEIVRREMVVGRDHLGMGAAALDRRVMAMVEGHVLRAMAEALVLLELEGELLRVGLGHRVTAAGRDRLGMEMVGAGRRLLHGQQHLRLALHQRRVLLLRLVLLLLRRHDLHRRRDLHRLGQRREVLSRGIRKEERSRRNGLSRRLVRDRAGLVAITMAQRHGRPVIAAKPVLAAAEHVREANLDEALQA